MDRMAATTRLAVTSPMAASANGCSEELRPTCRWWRPTCSVSLVAVAAVPVVLLVMILVVVTWTMLYLTALSAMEMLMHQGQALFVQAARQSILAYTDSIQQILTVNRPQWENTSCDGLRMIPNQTPFNLCPDTRLALWSHVYNLSNSDASNLLVGVAFPNGAVLAYQQTAAGKRWVIGDHTSKAHLNVVYSETWDAATWRQGPQLDPLPPSLLQANGKFNATTLAVYKDAVRKGRQSWSFVFYGEACNWLILQAVMPVFHPDGRLKLIALTQSCLTRLDYLLHTLQTTPNTVAFVAEMNGQLLATLPAGLATAGNASTLAPALARVSITQTNGTLLLAGRWLLDQFGSLDQLPLKDTYFIAVLGDAPYYLFTGHIVDAFGLHWLVMVAVPRSDLMGSLDHDITRAMVIIGVVLLLALILLAAGGWRLQRSLRQFLELIRRIGTMDLKDFHQTTCLSEVKLILDSLQRTVNNLREFRAFLPHSVLPVEELPAADTRPQHEDAAPPSPIDLRSHTSVPPDDASSFLAGPLERRLTVMPVTLLLVELPELHRGHPGQELLAWYEAGLAVVLEAAEKHHGDFIRLIGDQALLSWGAVKRSASQCSKACHAACQISDALRRLDDQRLMLLSFNARLSVVSGIALCGVMGTTAVRDWHLVGPLFKRGAALASLNASYCTRILVDSGVAFQCGSLFKMQPCGLVRAVTDNQLVELVHELLQPVEENSQEVEWMYNLTQDVTNVNSSTRYAQAFDSLRRGQLEQGQRKLHDIVRESHPNADHAARMLARIVKTNALTHGLEGLLDC